MHTQSKREHIAAHWLRAQLGVETYLPRLKFRRLEPRGAVWTTEALFPTYLFARLEVSGCLQQVECVAGVIGVVRFGSQCPVVPDSTIEQLRAEMGWSETRVIEVGLVPQQEVQVVSGPFRGLEAVVTGVLPARERVKVLLDFLGRQTVVEMSAQAVEPATDARRRVLGRDVEPRMDTDGHG